MSNTSAPRRAILLAAALLPCGAAVAVPFDHEYRDYARVLAQHVDAGRVDYAAIKAEPAALQRHLAAITRVDPAMLTTFTRDQRLAFWLNAYNSLVLQTIVDAYPIKRGSLVGLGFPANSIWQIPRAFSGRRFRVAGRELSLDDIEHKIIRREFDEPRVHVALVCAARGCPPLRAEPYTSAALERMLSDSARRFVADSTHGARWDAVRNELWVSSIFKWFKEDFAALGSGNPDAGIREFIARNVANERTATDLRARAPRLRYLDYDWTLNDR
jgi:Protein of unknown function, DUF547